MSSKSTMSNFFRSFSKRSSRSTARDGGSIRGSTLDTGSEQPPPYAQIVSDAPSQQETKGSDSRTPVSMTSAPATSSVFDDPYAFLAKFDTIFLVDDSGSMIGSNWRQTADALEAITPICTLHDSDGIDIYFLNHRNRRRNSGLAEGGYHNINNVAAVREIFSTVRPQGATPTGTRLNQILKPYMDELEDLHAHRKLESHPVKPLNIIVVTDGVPTDDVESVIARIARRLDAIDAEPWQVGIQFFQVGDDRGAAESLQDLDDAMATTYKVRDMVDTVPWTGSSRFGISSSSAVALNGEGILKVVLGSVNRRLDRRSNNDTNLRGYAKKG